MEAPNLKKEEEIKEEIKQILMEDDAAAILAFKKQKLDTGRKIPLEETKK
ncbi:MAG: hypothetical protein H7A23_05960 [Leptospiraceae bacterium]|nr:hypothetical protein [Leptospiraceae bacterium]MCP5494084.1 hypothetical protein [Leptospiraceae bacterium]